MTIPRPANFNDSKDYVCYTDDIFVGYRYFETIPGAAEKVNYPFGFGLSYTSFDLTCEKTEIDSESIAVTLRVTNTGAYAGKEVLQLYTSAPKCRLEMPKLELRAFRKTDLLKPGESRTVTLRVPTSELSVYDEKLAAYVLPAGSYRILPEPASGRSAKSAFSKWNKSVSLGRSRIAARRRSFRSA